MSDKGVPPQIFYGHLERLRQTWANKFDTQFDSIIIANGKSSQGNQKSIAIVGWFLAGYNFTDTILFFNKTEISLFVSERKMTYLKEVKNSPNSQKFKLKFFFSQKDQDNNSSFQTIWNEVHNGKTHPKVGTIMKDSKIGGVVQQFQKFFKTKPCSEVDVSHFFNECFASKNTQQIENIKKSALITTHFLDKFTKQIEKVIDEGRLVKHKQLTEQMQAMLANEAQIKKCLLKLTAKNPGMTFLSQCFDVGASLCIQSGGVYSNLLFSQPTQQAIKSDCIVFGLGTIYRGYNTYASRTLLIDPTENQKNTYKKVLALCKIIQQNLKPGVALNQIYDKIGQFMKQHLPEIEIPKSFGFGIGVFVSQTLLEINQTNNRTIQVGNAFLINCHFPNLKYQTKNGTKTYCIKISDVVVVTDKGQQFFTSGSSTALSDISYALGEDQPDQKKQSKKNPNIISSEVTGRPVTRGGPKAQNTMKKINNQKKRAEHQMQLKKKKLEQLKERVNQNFIGGFKKQKNIECSKLQCYKSRQDLPKQMKKNQIYVDSKNNTILLPINGKHVPFNIHTLKSVVKNDEGRYSSLRFNFHLPGTIANLTFPKFNQSCIYVKEMVFRSQNVARISDLQKQIKALQKKVKLDISQRHAKQDIVQQEVLKQNKGKKPILRDLFARPGIGQKKVKGILQCHLNGFRYSTSKGEIIDVAFSNIKYAFFQPCEKQIIAAIHFRLHQPILIGKKKSEDVQFYSEGGPNAEDVGGRGRGGYGAQDEDDQERQKQSRRKLDKQFRAWMTACDQFKGKYFEWQIPNREGGFYGNPFNNNSLLQPTKNCLINITENRFFIASIDQVELACFQRMYSNVKSFDMILVMKDYENFMKVSSIPIKDVEKVKDWLDANNIIFYDQGKNLNWIKFLGTIRKDFKRFVDDGAWMAWDEADQQDEQHQQDNDQSFQASQSDFDQESEDSESSSEYQQENGSSSGSGSGDQELSEQGLSSDQLDERAEMEDRQRDKRQMERQRQKQKQKFKSNGNGKPNPVKSNGPPNKIKK